MTDFLHHARVAMSVGDKQSAYNHLQAAIAAGSADAEAWRSLGHMLSELRKHEAAAAAFARANALSPDDATTLVGLGWALHLAGNDDAAFQHIKRAADIDPPSALALVDLAALEIGEHSFHDALEHAKSAVAAAPELPVAHMMLSFAHFHRGEWLDGFREYEWRFRYKMPQVLNYPYPLWRGERVDRLFIQAEQGIGDTVQCARWIALAASRVGSVEMHVHKELLSLMKGAFGPPMVIKPMPTPVPPADAWCPMFSLPVALVGADMLEPPTWLSPVGHVAADEPPKRIGICWAGNPEHDAADQRDVGLAPFLRLAARRPTVQFYSLQIGPRSGDIAALGAPGIITDLSTHISSVADTLWQIRSRRLDCVITADTALAHIAGSVGLPTTMLVNQRAVDWRWGMAGASTLWYPSLRIERRAADETWNDVMDRL